MSDYARENALLCIAKKLNAELTEKITPALTEKDRVSTINKLFDKYLFQAEMLGYNKSWLKYKVAQLRGIVK